METQEKVKVYVELVRLHEQFKDVVRLRANEGQKLGEKDRINEHDLMWHEIFKKQKILCGLIVKSDVWLIDYTAYSFSPIKFKKNRYFLNANGQYMIKGLVVALNTTTRKLLCVETQSKQLNLKDVLRLRKYLPKNSIVLTDKQHSGFINIPKNCTQLIENYFGGLKNQIESIMQSHRKILKGYCVSELDYDTAMALYYGRIKNLKWKILEYVEPQIQKKW